jgi:hypothetical protein
MHLGIKLAWLCAAVLSSNGAFACSCTGIDHAGFVHTAAKRLPSNARGALFLPPAGDFAFLAKPAPETFIYSGDRVALSPKSFKITSSEGTASIPVVLSYPHLPRAAEDARTFKFVRKSDEHRAGKMGPHDVARLLKVGVLVDITDAERRAARLVRVGPAGGFKPGVRYRIAYLGKVGNWRFPAEVEHVIDSVPLTPTASAYPLVIDGPPISKLLPLISGSGSCSSNQPALVQRFHYVLPAAQTAYADAFVFASEARPADNQQGAYTRLRYLPSLCPSEPFASTAFPGGNDIVHAPCNSRPVPVEVRGWAGMLEVEDRLRPAGAIRVDLAKAAGGSCTGIGMLKDALAGGDPAHIKEATCALGQESARFSGASGESLAGFPTDALFTRFASSDVQLQQCARKAAVRLFTATQVLGGANLPRYAALIESDLRSSDPRRVAMAAEGLTELKMNFSHTRSVTPAGMAPEALLAAILDAVVHALITNRTPETEGLVTMLAPVRQQAMRHVPVLLDVAATQGAGAGNAMLALEQLMPDDARLHKLLVDNAKRPKQRERAALVYSRVAGKAHPEVATALLTDAARAGSWDAIEALAAYRRSARDAAPVLVALLRSPPDKEMRDAILRTLISVSDGDAGALRVVGEALNARAGEYADYSFAPLATLGVDGRALLPAFEVRMRRPLSPGMKNILVQSIATMGLSAAQREDWLARLGKVPLEQDR